MSECYVYLIESDAVAPNGPWLRDAEFNWKICKIGISQNPWSRCAEFQTASAFRLFVVKAWKFPYRSLAEDVERECHAALFRHRLYGEWFFYERPILEFTIDDVICTLAAQVWGWPPKETEALLIKNGHSQESAYECVGANYGEYECGEPT